eukprot:g58871.t1
MHIVRAWVELQLLHSPSRQRWAWCVEVFANAVKAVEAAPRTGARLSVIKSLQLRQVEWLEAHRAPGAFPSAPSVTALESALAAIPSRGTPSLEVYLAVFQAMRRLGGSVNSDQQAKRQEVSSSPTPIPLSAALVMQEASRVYGETEPELWLHWLKASPSAARATLHTRALKTLRPPYHSAYTTGAMHIWSGSILSVESICRRLDLVRIIPPPGHNQLEIMGLVLGHMRRRSREAALDSVLESVLHAPSQRDRLN